MEGALDDLLRHPALWRAGERVGEDTRGWRAAAVASGFTALDRHLPGGGWPLGALTEVLHEPAGIGELSLFLPALSNLCAEGRWLAWVAPPYRLAAPALEAGGVRPDRVLVIRQAESASACWAVEQALRSGACGAVLWWPDTGARSGQARSGQGFRELRRLQLAAQEGHSLGVVFRAARAARESSPSALRVLLRTQEQGLEVTLLKSRGGRRARVMLEAVDLSAASPAMPHTHDSP